jgi:hypothetical protein
MRTGMPPREAESKVDAANGFEVVKCTEGVVVVRRRIRLAELLRPDLTPVSPCWPYGLASTYLEQAIPASRAERDPVSADAQARDSVVVPRKDAHPLPFERVPDIAVVVVVSSEQDPAGN